MTQSYKTISRQIKYEVLYQVVIAAINVSNILPRNWWLNMCGTIGKLVSICSPGLNKRIKSHLMLAYGEEKTQSEIQDLAGKVVTTLSKNAGLILRNFKTSTSNFNRQRVTHGEEYADEAFKSGRGVIFLTAHLGPFECIAHDLALRGYHPFIVGTPLKDSKLNRLLTKNRTKFGAVAIERGKDTVRVMKNIATGGTMAILIDQDTRVKSVFVDFFGRPCATPVGATVLALKTGAAIIPVFAHLNEDGRPEIEYYPEVALKKTGNEESDLISNTQTLTTIIENEIRKFPEQWVWMHKRWKTTKQVDTDSGILK